MVMLRLPVRGIAGQRTFTGTAKVFVVYSMATPRLPPAPLMPQNRSGWLVADIVWRTAFLSALRVTQTSSAIFYSAKWHPWWYFTPVLSGSALNAAQARSLKRLQPIIINSIWPLLCCKVQHRGPQGHEHIT